MDHHNQDGVNLMREWYHAQGFAVQARFDYLLRVLEGTPDVQNWIEKERFKILIRKKHVGLCELRFAVQNRGKARKFRPLGFWYPNRAEFILVTGVEKIGKTYVPPEAFDIALDAQLNFFRNGIGTLYEHVNYSLE